MSSFKENNIIDYLMENLDFFSTKKIYYNNFKKFISNGFFHSSNLSRTMTNKEKDVLSVYEGDLLTYWSLFPDSLYKYPLIKDLSFFLLCLFNVRNPSDEQIIKRIWSLTIPVAEPRTSPYLNISYYAPGDYASFLSPRTKSHRLNIALKVLTFFEESLYTPENYRNRIRSTQETYLDLDLVCFLEKFHLFVFSAPKSLTFNDLCIISSIIIHQSDNRQLLIKNCNLNKNTVTSRLKWLNNHNIIYYRPRIVYSAFNLIPKIILFQDNRNKNISFSPWLTGQIKGSENRLINYYLVPNTLQIFKNDNIIELERIVPSIFSSYNLDSFNPLNNQWDINCSFFPQNSDKNHIFLRPFVDYFSSIDFDPALIYLKLLNFYLEYPSATQRETCNALNISSKTLVLLNKTLNSRNIMKWLFGLYPISLPYYASFFISTKSIENYLHLLKEITSRVPIVNGGSFKGSYHGIDLQIPFGSIDHILNFRDYLISSGYELFWFQINDHPYASRWKFPLHLWNDNINDWEYENRELRYVD